VCRKEKVIAKWICDDEAVFFMSIQSNSRNYIPMRPLSLTSKWVLLSICPTILKGLEEEKITFRLLHTSEAQISSWCTVISTDNPISIHVNVSSLFYTTGNAYKWSCAMDCSSTRDASYNYYHILRCARLHWDPSQLYLRFCSLWSLKIELFSLKFGWENSKPTHLLLLFLLVLVLVLWNRYVFARNNRNNKV